MADKEPFGIEPQDGSSTTTNNLLAGIRTELEKLSVLAEILTVLKDTSRRLDDLHDQLEQITGTE